MKVYAAPLPHMKIYIDRDDFDKSIFPVKSRTAVVQKQEITLKSVNKKKNQQDKNGSLKYFRIGKVSILREILLKFDVCFTVLRLFYSLVCRVN